MSHIVIYDDVDGVAKFRQFDDLGNAVAYLEEHQNVAAVCNAKLFELNEVPFEVRSCVKIEIVEGAAGVEPGELSESEAVSAPVTIAPHEVTPAANRRDPGHRFASGVSLGAERQLIARSSRKPAPNTVTPMVAARAMPRPITMAARTMSERMRSHHRTYAFRPTVGRSTRRRMSPRTRRLSSASAVASWRRRFWNARRLSNDFRAATRPVALGIVAGSSARGDHWPPK